MKQLHTVAAVLLLFPNLGLTQNRMYETFYNIQAMDLAKSPGPLSVGLIGAETAYMFIDEICGQVPEGSDPEFTISGAYNMGTGDFMTWEEYITSGVWQNGNAAFYWASGPWHTFKGTCSLKPASAWAENSYTSEGRWARNMGSSGAPSRTSRVEIRLPGFSAETLMFSWHSRCENVDQMADTFRAMPGLSEDLKSIWKGLQLGFRQESVKVYPKSIEVPFGHEGQTVATTMVIVVQAHLVLNVKEWYWYYEPEMSGIATGWQGMGGPWDYVYSKHAWVRAKGLAQQTPVSPIEPIRPRPDWWYCVNMGPWNTNLRLYHP
jgi:hypothetical protein